MEILKWQNIYGLFLSVCFHFLNKIIFSKVGSPIFLVHNGIPYFTFYEQLLLVYGWLSQEKGFKSSKTDKYRGNGNYENLSELD